jgi:tRNA-2-methylthio-N6-dimethylallyladenosine synthase
MFIYSPRPGTPAGEMEQLPLSVRKGRIDRLISLQTGITIEKNREAVGKVFEVLVEGPSPKNPERLQGYTREFKMMHFDGPAQAGDVVPVEAVDAHLWGLSGRLV